MDILVKDRLKSVQRAQRLDEFDYSGPRIYLGDTNKPMVKYYALKLQQTVFEEEDKSKACENYPNTYYKSYHECDDDFVQNILKKIFPEGFMPIWASDMAGNVTSLIKLTTKLSKKQDTMYTNLMKGSISTKCPLPCKSTEIKAILNDEKNASGNQSKIDIVFSNNVFISTTKFKKFYVGSFVSGLGGQMGFWLGLGVLQMLELVFSSIWKMIF